MKIIPVIDLKNGVVVHAKQGDRANYQPINSQLCQSSDIYDVINAFLQLYNFDTFYIADLNAITNQGNHDDLIKAVLAFFPQQQFWIDKGFYRYQAQAHNYIPVLGSECYREDTLAELNGFNKQFILSLDYSANGALGANSLFVNSAHWSDTIIIMTLARVGSYQGADFVKLSAFCQLYPEKNFVAAGGIRHLNDLKKLQQIGVKQALIASALHSGAIAYAELLALEKSASIT